MDQHEIELVLDVCHQVDLLVSQDPGTTDLEVLERLRLKMNDLLYKKRYREAENLAYAIMLRHSGQEADRYLSEIEDS